MLFYFSGSLLVTLSNMHVISASIVKLISKHQIFSCNSVSFGDSKLYSIFTLAYTICKCRPKHIALEKLQVHVAYTSY